jgi:hypothetical protein
VIKEMALKLALVDLRHLAYRDLGKSPSGVAKAEFSLEMRRILDDPTRPKDVKSKLYQQALDKFKNLRDESVAYEEPLPPINYVEPYKKKKKKNTTPVRRSSRRISKPKWIDY